MAKNILIISSTLRKNGNSEMLARAFADGANEGGNKVDFISLSAKTLAFCRGCFACLKNGRCVIEDDANQIVDKMMMADVLVFASPVYYYSIAGQLKTMLDRANSLYSSNYAFRDVYFLATAAEDEEGTVEGSVKAIEGWVECFPRATLKEVVFAGGGNDIGDIKKHPALAKAFTIGKNI